ncbi:hypothetical protein HDU67_009624 [Dinochytrium kinnereticum]|nr:hypothetical protein HDU67_009624 [Dinochytrium kinnereticum]
MAFIVETMRRMVGVMIVGWLTARAAATPTSTVTPRSPPVKYEVQKFDINITETFTGESDCFERASTLYVNGQFPAPEIRINAGDTLEITVRNFMYTQPVSVHLHGLDQKGTPFYDGASRISQDPILPGDSFTIRTKTRPDQAGTYFYHAHYGMLTLDGPLILEGAKERSSASLGYDDDRVVVVSDWWHATAETQIQNLLSSKTFRWIGNADSILTNGKSVFSSCTPVSAANASALYPTQYDVVEVDPGKTYRFRLIGALSLHQVHFLIPNHTMTIFEVDGTYITPTPVSFLSIAPGQRYSVLIKTDQPPADYWMNTEYRWRGTPGASNGQSILRYSNAAKSSSPPSPIITKTPSEIEGLEWGKDFTPVQSLRTVPYPRGPPTREIVLEGKQQRVNGYLRWTMNDVSYRHMTDRSLLAFAYLDQTELVAGDSQMMELRKGEVIDVVLQNTAALNGVCEVHPWHLHGHTFWDLGGGPGKYTPNSSNVTTNYPLTDPIMRDTVVVYPYSGALNQPTIPAGEPCGWKKIRFVADNPGVWPFHCHVTSHMVMGMMVVFAEDLESLPRAPQNVMAAFKHSF